MGLSPNVKALVVVVIFAVGLGFLWLKYSDFLHQGSKPPESAVILNKIEVEGFPEFVVQDHFTGEDLSLKSFAGKIVILNFWASWCDPCIAEFPSLLKLIDKYEGQVILFAISADYEKQDIDNFLKVFKLANKNVRIAWDKDLNIAKMFGTYKLPESYIIGRDGKLIRKVSGVDDWSTAQAFEYFAHLLAK